MKFILNLALILSLTLSAQTDLGIEHSSKKLEEKARFHIDRSFEIADIDSAHFHANQGLYYAERSNKEELIMEANHALGLQYKFIYDYESSKKYMTRCQEIANKLGNIYFQYLTNSLLGVIKASEKQYQVSTNYYNKALVLAKEAKDTINESLIYQNIALNYYFIEQFELAKMYMFKSLNTYNSIHVFNDHLQQDSDYIYLYMKLSLVADTRDEALEFADLAIKRALKTGFHNYTALVHLYKGRVYLKYGDFELAIKNYQEALRYNKLANTNSPGPYIELINGLVKMKKYEKAKMYLDTLHNNFSENEIRPLYVDKNKLRSRVYQNTGNYDKALYYAEIGATISDSLLKYYNYDMLAEYGKKFETTEKENEIKQQQLIIEKQKNENKNLLLYGFSSLFGVLLLFQWLYHTQRNKKRKMEVAYSKEYEFNQVRTSFLENISHEIRTPLTLINGYLNLIDEETSDNPKLKGYINNALLNSKKVIFDADEILNLLKFEDHKMSLVLESKPLNKFLEQVYLSFQILANTRNVKLIYKSRIPDDCVVEMDFGKMERILTNLVSNAIKFSGSNTRVILEAVIRTNNLQVAVIDFGHGIDREDQKRIFTRFYQTKNNKSIGGIGIGLLLAKDFAQFLGGDLTVESEIGKGSTFKFSIPLPENISVEECNQIVITKDKNGQSINRQSDDDIAVIDPYKPSILVVEDNIEMTKYLKEILSPFYNCAFASNGSEGLNLAKKMTFDIIASDVMMPKIDGYEFKKLLKSLPEYRTIPFILITAKSLPEDKIKGFSIGIDDYITKPFVKEELIVRINNLLKNSSELKLSIADPNPTIQKFSETYTDKLLKEIEDEIVNNLSNDDFKVDDLALKMNYSQRQLSRILNRYTGLSTIKFILEIKLREAYRLLKSNRYKTISEVQYKVGITSPSYFSKKFKNRFGISPSELIGKQ